MIAALNHLRLCQWDDAIAECREVVENLVAPIGAAEQPPPWAEYPQKPQRELWSFAQRCAALRVMLRHATHDAHHGGHDFKPGQARYIVDLTGVALKFYSEQLR